MNKIIDSLRFEALTVGHLLCLERVGSNLFSKEPTTQDIANAIFIMSRPAKESRELFASGKDRFAEAVDVLAESIPTAELRELGERIRHYMEQSLPPLPKNKAE